MNTSFSNLRLVEVEICSFCNRQCWFCPNSFIDRHSYNNLMELDVYTNTLKSLSSINYKGMLSFSRYNEPLAHKNIFLARLRQAREVLPDAILHTNTNGDYLDKQYLQELYNAGLNSLNIQCYLKKDEVFNIDNIKGRIVKTAEMLDVEYKILIENIDWVEATFIYRDLNIRMYARDFSYNGNNRADSLNIVPKIKREAPCHVPLTDMYVDYNGNVMPCCNFRSDIEEHKKFIMGNLNVSTMQEIFNGESYKRLRHQLINTNITFSPCNQCSFSTEYRMAQAVSPKTLFNYKRLDLIDKYLYAWDVLHGVNNKEIKSLYTRQILMRTLGLEPINEYADAIKNNINDYYKHMKTLLQSLESGYDKNKPIPITPDGRLANGAHRIAAASALGIDVYTTTVTEGNSIDFEWFDKCGFTIEDKQRLLKGFIDFNPNNSAIFIIWNPMFKYYGHFKAIIEKYLHIVGEVELDFENNFIAFKNVLLDIYEPNGARSDGAGSETILAKAELLQSHKLCFKVVVVTDQNTEGIQDIHQIVVCLKKEFRKAFDFEIPKDIFATLHTSDSVQECRYLSSILLSPNNIKHVRMRMNYRYEDNFIIYCERVKEVCKTLGISTDSICLIGSSVLTVLGIKKIGDVDFTVSYSLREKLGDAAINLAPGVDIGVKGGAIIMPEGDRIDDDVLVNNSEYHFTFKGLKFANLNVIKKKKQLSMREKDIVHLRMIELYEKLEGMIPQTFQEYIEKEMLRRGLLVNNSDTKAIGQGVHHISGNNDINARNITIGGKGLDVVLGKVAELIFKVPPGQMYKCIIKIHLNGQGRLEIRSDSVSTVFIEYYKQLEDKEIYIDLGNLVSYDGNVNIKIDTSDVTGKWLALEEISLDG